MVAIITTWLNGFKILKAAISPMQLHVGCLTGSSRMVLLLAMQRFSKLVYPVISFVRCVIYFALVQGKKNETLLGTLLDSKVVNPKHWNCIRRLKSVFIQFGLEKDCAAVFFIALFILKINSRVSMSLHVSIEKAMVLVYILQMDWLNILE